MNASRPSEHPPARGEMSKRLSGIIGCKDKTCLLLCSSNELIGPQSYPVIYVVVNPVVRGPLDRKMSEEHQQSSNESMKTKKNDKKKGTISRLPVAPVAQRYLVTL